MQPSANTTIKACRKLIFLLNRVSWRFSWSHRLLTGFTLAGIALGVGVFFSIQLTNQSVLHAFSLGVNALADDHQLEIVRDDGQPLDERVLPRIRHAVGTAEVVPVSETVALVGDKTNDVIRLYGSNLLTRQSQEQPWSSQLTADPFAIFQLNTVYVTQTLAKRHHWALGQAITLLVNDQRQTVRVVGILEDNPQRVIDRQLVLMDIGGYQALTGQAGLVDRLHVVGEGTVNTTRLKAVLPPHWQAQPPQRRAERAKQLVMAFQQNLQALGFVALLVGLFLVYNTMTIFVVQRHSMLATLRALGLSRCLMASLVLTEAGLLGLSGSILGVLLGWLLAQASLSGVSQTIQMVYAGQAVTRVWPSWDNVALTLTGGTLLTVLASIPACWQALIIAPADTLRPARPTRMDSPWPQRLLFAGVTLCGLSAWLATLPAIGGRFPLFGYLATFALFLGLAGCVPIVVRYGLRCSAFRWPVMLAVGLGHCQRAWGKTSIAVASLMVGIALMLSMAILIGSFRQSVITWVESTLRADVLIEPRLRTVRKGAGMLTPATVAAIRQLPDVADVDPFVQREVPLDRIRTVFVATGNLPLLAQRGHLDVLSGQPYQAALRQLSQFHIAHPTTDVPVMVSEPLAVKLDLKAGQAFRLPGIPYRLHILSIYRDFSSEQGYAILPTSVFNQLSQTTAGITSLAVYLKPNASAQHFRQAVAQALPASRLAALQLRTNRELRRDVLVIFDNTFGVTYALFAIALVVSALCVLITLLTLVLESQTELTLLRFLGASRQQVTQLVLTQATVLALGGYGFGLVAGLGLAAILVFVINRQSFGWSVDFILPPWDFLVWTGLGLFSLALVAGYAPARWIQSRLQPDVLRYV